MSSTGFLGANECIISTRQLISKLLIANNEDPRIYQQILVVMVGSFLRLKQDKLQIQQSFYFLFVKMNSLATWFVTTEVITVMSESIAYHMNSPATLLNQFV